MSITGKRNRLAALRARRAFTLVEMIVVIVLISIALTMTAVSLSSATGGVACKESAARLLSALRFARYYSTTHGCPCIVRFTRETSSYELTCRPDPDHDDYEEPLPAGRVAALDRHVHFVDIDIQSRQPGSENQNAITFQPTGECDGARIELTDDHTVYTLSVQPYSGIVQLHKGRSREIPNDREDLDG